MSNFRARYLENTDKILDFFLKRRLCRQKYFFNGKIFMLGKNKRDIEVVRRSTSRNILQ